MREWVRGRKDQGADFIKIFAAQSIREGGAITLTQADLAKAATLAGCTSIEHGAYITDEVFDLMAKRGTYYDPNIGLVLQNYLENKPKYFGVCNYNE